jgi:hypothetical protein
MEDEKGDRRRMGRDAGEARKSVVDGSDSAYDG